MSLYIICVLYYENQPEVGIEFISPSDEAYKKHFIDAKFVVLDDNYSVHGRMYPKENFN